MILACLECSLSISVADERVILAPASGDEGHEVAWAAERQGDVLYCLHDQPIMCPMHDVRFRMYDDMPWLVEKR